MDNNINTIGFFTSALLILFIALKLTGHIAWNWLWVLSPLWITTAVAIIFIVILLLMWKIYTLNKRLKRKKKK